MATLTLYGPAEDLTALWVATDAAARHARTTGHDARTLDQLRFDLLTGLAWTALDTGHLGCCHPHCTTTDRSSSAANPDAARPADAARLADAARPAVGPVLLGRRRGRPATVHVTVPLTSLRGEDDAPGDLDGYGPITATTARRIAAHATWRRLL
ncbi:hypothetical protein DY240_03630, partial [Jiangella rhizosphaerae]